MNDSDYGRLECSATNSVGSGGPPCQYRIAQPVRLDDDDDDDDDNGGDKDGDNDIDDNSPKILEKKTRR